MKSKFFTMALLALLGVSCTKHQTPDTKKQAPITKPSITLESDRFTAEALWAMGRIGAVTLDIETGWIAYTVSYYSVPENRSTTWIRICVEDENGLQTIDEFVGSDPAWFGNSGVLAYIKSGKLYLRQNKKDIEVKGLEKIKQFDIEKKAKEIDKINASAEKTTLGDLEALKNLKENLEKQGSEE